MADLTFYFATVGSAAHDCAYSDYWDNTSQAVRYPATTSRTGEAETLIAHCYRTNGQHLGCGGQWVSAALSARSWTTTDTFDITMVCYDVNVVGGSTFALSIRVFNAAGDTEVGVLYEGVVNSTLWVSPATSRHADGVAVQNNVDLPEGGHIVIEIGMHEAYAASFENRIYIGEAAVGESALPLNDADTDSDKYPWLAFTYGAATETNVVQMIL